jgi:hypothetical protein
MLLFIGVMLAVPDVTIGAIRRFRDDLVAGDPTLARMR